MPCPHGESSVDTSLRATFSRRGFLESALAVGGSGALGACLERTKESDIPRGTADQSALPARQFAWNEWLPRGPHGNPFLPGHQLIVFWNYAGDGTPNTEERAQVERAFRAVEEAYQRGTGDEFNPTSTDGLLYFVGYSRAYFDRYGETLPARLDLQRPGTVLDTLDESAAADTYDAVTVLTSDTVPVLLSVEQALRGELETVNGVEMTSLAGALEPVARRTGFLGRGRPTEELSVDSVPETSPTAMGFKSSFRDNQAGEDTVAIPDGRFADGTTLQVSRLVFDLEARAGDSDGRGEQSGDSDGASTGGWYDRDREARIELMFSPEHDEERVGDIGERLAGKSQIERKTVENVDRHARREGRVGHTQKVAAARDESFEPRILRRSEGVSTDLSEPSMNFLSLQQGLEDFVETRRAMNGDHLDTEVSEENDGIRHYVTVRRRGTFIVPPRRLRALPTPGRGD